MEKNHQFHSKGMDQELGILREEIRKFADTLQLFESDIEFPGAEETIKTLRGISMGAFSCAELLALALRQSEQSCQTVSPRRITLQDQVKENVEETLHCCADLSTSLRSLKQILRTIPAAELGGMEQASQRVQAALSNIATEWEDL